MRKFLFLVFFMATAVFVFSQNTGITSIFNDSSFGIFENELDWAVNVGSEFTTLQHDYLFTGLANLEKTSVSTTANFDNGGTPLWGGFFKSGNNPWSLFSGFTASDSSGNQAGGTTYTAGASTSDGTTTWQWNQTVAEKEYTANRLFDDMDFAGQYLFMLGDFNTGVYLRANINDSSNQTNNYTETQKWYYNSTGGGVAPTPLADYTRSITQTAKNITSTFIIGVPFLMQTGDLDHEINAIFGLTLVDNSTSLVDRYTAPANATLNITNTIANEVTNTDATVGLYGTYTLTGPGIWGNSTKNEFYLTAELSGNMEIPDYSTKLTTQAVSYAGGGAAGVDGVRDDDSDKRTFKNAFDFSLLTQAKHSFFYELGPSVNFAVKPAASIKLSMDNEALLDTKVVVDRQDNDADGAFTSAADRIVTTTTTYTNTDTTSGNNDSTIDITTTLDLPVAATIAPDKWPFFITLGSKVEIQLVNSINITKTAANSVHTLTVDGTGTTVSDTTVNAQGSDETSVINTTIGVTAEHNIGLTMPIGQFVKLDVSLDLSSAINILDFKDLVIQAIISMP